MNELVQVEHGLAGSEQWGQARDGECRPTGHGQRQSGGVEDRRLFHEVVVQRRGVGLDDEGIGSAHAFAGADVDLTVGEVVRRRRGRLDVRVRRHPADRHG